MRQIRGSNDEGSLDETHETAHVRPDSQGEMPPSLLIGGVLCYFGGVGAFSVSAGYALAPFVQRGGKGPVRRAALTCNEPDSPPEETELRLVKPPAAGGLRTESQSRRLAPVRPLKRKRRSRRLRKPEISDDKFVPLVKGARETTSDAILKAYQVPTELDKQQRAGEDYYLDPDAMLGKVEPKQDPNPNPDPNPHPNPQPNPHPSPNLSLILIKVESERRAKAVAKKFKKTEVTLGPASATLAQPQPQPQSQP